MRNISGNLRYLGRIKNGTTPSSSESNYWDGDVKWATPEDLGKSSGDRISKTKRQVTELAIEESNLSIIPKGSIIISTRAPIGHMAINDEPMAFNQGCRGIIPGERVHGPFLFYLLKSRVPQLNAIANGTTFVELSRDELAAIPVNLPSLETQCRIADFLDEKTARIDELIEKKQSLLDKLAEKRQALITRAVTKGLNPDAPMKPSGIDWLGDIPKHWEIMRIKELGQLIGGAGFPHEYQGEPDLELPFFKVIDIGRVTQNEPMITTENTVDHKIARLLGASLILPGDIVFAKVGAALLLNRFRLVGISCCIDNNMMAFRSGNRISSEFGLAALSRINFSDIVNPGAVPSVNSTQVGEIEIALPTRTEQHQIFEYLSTQLSDIEIGENQIQTSNDLLSEYRSALITAAVTGQIRELL